MKRIKLFESFEIESFDDIDDILLSLQEQGILKFKSKPFINYDKSQRGAQTLGNLNPKLSVIYEINKELLKIDSLEKITLHKKLIDELYQAVSRLNMDYLLDFTKLELEINLPLPPGISELFSSIYRTNNGDLNYSIWDSVEGNTAFLSIKRTIKLDEKDYEILRRTIRCIEIIFSVDENFKISVSTILVDRESINVNTLPNGGGPFEYFFNPLIEYFEKFGLKYINTTKDNTVFKRYAHPDKCHHRLNFISQ